MGISEYCWFQSLNQNCLLITSQCLYDEMFIFSSNDFMAQNVKLPKVSEVYPFAAIRVLMF